MTEHDDILDRLIRTLKEPVHIDRSLDSRVMQAVGQLRPHGRRAGLAGWLARRWTIRLSPLGALAAAAAVAAIVLAANALTEDRQPAAAARTEALPAASGAVTQFVLVAPDAKSVALVGDFNDWSFSATRLVRQPGDGIWWVTVKLPPGRYRYAFVVDGANWRSDPAAPAAEDEFGRPNSVVTIGGA